MPMDKSGTQYRGKKAAGGDQLRSKGQDRGINVAGGTEWHAAKGRKWNAKQ